MRCGYHGSMAERAVLFYDGGCGLCHRAVIFALRRDQTARFLFAPLGGETYSRLIPTPPQPLPDSLILLEGDRLFLRSGAVLRLLGSFGSGWRVLAILTGVCPKFIRDLLYDLVARFRRQLFPPPDTTCPVVPPEFRARFLP